MKKKKILTVVSVIAIFIIAIIAFAVIKTLLNDGYAYYGDVWESSPERALQKATEQDFQTMETLTPKINFKKTVIDDIVLMTFLSESDTLVTVTFVSNEDGQYSVYGWTEEYDLDHPTEFLLSGEPNQLILFPYQEHNNIVLGWCYSTARFTVDGATPTRETFSFSANGKTYSIDFWMIEGHTSNGDAAIEYLPN